MVELDPPSERECQRCGRRDVWDPDETTWRIDGAARAGNPHCIHEWDINGAYRPIRD
ncbi:HEWD family protein [Halorussus salinus]|uniref:HEWD family protein n=1 Tax=Halorussus salinus TaxID=1364935 RepID=UPI00192F574E|nr:HEWD family protein [Halorussus salinus]